MATATQCVTFPFDLIRDGVRTFINAAAVAKPGFVLVIAAAAAATGLLYGYVRIRTAHAQRVASPAGAGEDGVTGECNPEACLERVDCVVCDKPVCPTHYPRRGLYAGEPTTADCMDSATVHPICHDEHCADPRDCRYEATDYLD